jgi:replication factor C subunit 1
LELIATRVVGGKGGAGYDEKTKKKMEKEEEAIRKGAKELEKREREMGKGKGKGDTSRRYEFFFCVFAWVLNSICISSKISDPSTQLWTTRYAPQTLKEICGNKGQVEKLQNWLNSWLVPPPKPLPSIHPTSSLISYP